MIDPTRLSIRPIWIKSDGGRAEAGYIGDAGDCVTRAIAIAGKLDYRAVYDCLAVGMQAKSVRGKRSARDGVLPKVYKPLLAEIGFEWVLTMKIGSGCMVHLRADELPAGRLICRVSKHLCAVIDGIVYDTYDPTRDGTRCVYGYWTKV